MNKLFAAIIAVSLCGCGIVMTSTRSEGNLQNLELGMERREVKMILGEPNSVRGAKKFEDGSELKVDEYRLYPANSSIKHFGLGFLLATFPWWVPMDQTSNYWVQYIDGKLDRWGRAGDWVPTVTGDLTIRNR